LAQVWFNTNLHRPIWRRRIQKIHGFESVLTNMSVRCISSIASVVLGCTVFGLVSAAPGKILILGDSMGEFSGTALQSFCKGSTVKNAGEGGTTAVQWATDAYVNKIVSAACAAPAPDKIWLSVGGNDHLNTKCGATAADLAAKVTASINAVKLKAPSAMILLTGYCSPPDAKECDAASKFTALDAALKLAADNGGALVTYVGSIAACGGSLSSWSPKKYFQDSIHLNNRGYCKVFTQSGVQAALGCQNATYDCDKVSCDTPGLKDSCNADATKKSCPECGVNCKKPPKKNKSGALVSGSTMLTAGLCLLWVGLGGLLHSLNESL